MRVVVTTVLSLALLAADAAAVSRTRQCREACGAAIASCIAEGGRPRRCRRPTIRLCKRTGTSACIAPPTTVPASTTTLRSTTTTPTTTSTTTTTRPPQGLAGLFGTWTFTYSIVSTFQDRYVMSQVQTSSQGFPFIPVYDVYDGLTDAVCARTADLGFPNAPFEFALLDASSLFCDFFVFNKTGATTISGNYYLTDIAFDGSCGDVVNPTTPYPLSGVRVGAALEARAQGDEAPVDVGALFRALSAVASPDGR
jgi:hypothetical protein